MKEIITSLRRGSFSRRYASHQPGAPLLQLEAIGVGYATGRVLDRISFQLNPGEGVALVGPNGAGKTTLFKVIAGILDPDQGRVLVSGHEPGGHTCIAYVPQRSLVDWSFPATVGDVVMMGRINKMGPFLWPQKEDWEAVRRSLEIVGLSDLAKRQIAELSGGQQQRMFIARALAQEAELMLLDEPLNGLDLPAQEGILTILETLRQDSQVAFMISMHDLRLAAEGFQKVMLLNQSMLGFGSPAEVFSRDLLLEAYRGHLHFVGGEFDTLAIGDDCCDGEDHEHI